MRRTNSKTFVPINLERYVELFVRANPGESPSAVRARLEAALSDHKAGVRCHCGNPIWVVGAAEAGNSCFTCITGDSAPSDDVELEDALGHDAA
jgi:hypothetical protein